MSDFKNDLGSDFESDEFSLESIMAEVKGTAFINSEKKTPPELLDQKADRIIREVLGDDIVNSIRASAPVAPTVNIQTADIPTITSTFASTTSAATSYSDTLSAPLTTSDFSLKESHTDNIPYNDPKLLLPDIETLLNTSTFAEQPLKQEPPLTTQSVSSMPKSAELDITSLTSELPDYLDITAATAAITNTINQDTPIIPEQPIRNVAPVERFASETDIQSTLFVNNYNPERQDTLSSIGFEVQNALEAEKSSFNDSIPREFLARNFNPVESDSVEFDNPQRVKKSKKRELFDDAIQPDFAAEEDIIVEPPLREAASKFAKDTNSISLRCIPATILAVLTVITTLAFEADMLIPFGIENSLRHTAGLLVFCQLIIMLLCIDIIYRGFDDLIKGAPGAETLILFSCVFSLISGFFTFLGGSPGFLPYSAVSACSLVFAAIGEKYSCRAITESLKTACSSSEPYGIQGEYSEIVDKTVLKKAYCRTDGFYINLMRPDISETAYRISAPVLLVFSLVFAVIVILFRDGTEYFLHVFAAFFAAAAPFSALLAFSLPFSVVVKSARNLGAAIAGWGGADDICYTDGACLTDEDLFPPGTLEIYNPKLFSGETLDKAVRYTASVIIASGSGLSRIFSEILKSDNKSEYRVEDFSCAEGGIRGLIRGELVETGSAAFMNLNGVRVPDGANMKNAVYTAINKRLVIVFPIEYTPVNSVQSALISLLKWRIRLFLAVRDFNVTPLMLTQKYKVSFEDIEIIGAKDSYAFSDANSGKEGRMTAVLVREGLGPYAEVLTGGRLLRSAALFAAILSVISAACGVFLIFYMCWAGAFLAATPGALLVFMLCMLVSVLLVCGYVKCRR